MNPKSLLCNYHPFFSRVTEKTRVFDVGSCQGVIHKCKAKTETLFLYQPIEQSNPAVHCPQCDCLWIQRVISDEPIQRETVVPSFSTAKPSPSAGVQHRSDKGVAGPTGEPSKDG